MILTIALWIGGGLVCLALLTTIFKFIQSAIPVVLVGALTIGGVWVLGKLVPEIWVVIQSVAVLMFGLLLMIFGIFMAIVQQLASVLSGMV